MARNHPIKILWYGSETDAEGNPIIPKISTSFEKRLEGLNEVTLEKFIRRMCLKKENLETFLLKRPQRAVEELQEELRRIGEQVKSCAVPSFAWERAVIGKNDLIFTAVNQRNAWTGTEVAEYDIPHYSEEIMRDLLCPSVI